MLLKRKIFKLRNFYPTEDFQLTNRKFHFLPLDQITELSKRTMHDKYFLTTAEMGSIVESFCATFAIEENQSLKKDEHYQLSGSKRQHPQ